MAWLVFTNDFSKSIRNIGLLGLYIERRVRMELSYALASRFRKKKLFTPSVNWLEETKQYRKDWGQGSPGRNKIFFQK